MVLCTVLNCIIPILVAYHNSKNVNYKKEQFRWVYPGYGPRHIMLRYFINILISCSLNFIVILIFFKGERGLVASGICFCCVLVMAYCVSVSHSIGDSSFLFSLFQFFFSSKVSICVDYSLRHSGGHILSTFFAFRHSIHVITKWVSQVWNELRRLSSH